MLDTLPVGARLDTMHGSTVRVLSYIGSGGQGSVYEVLYNDEHKALKWYHPESIGDPKRFVRNLMHNIVQRPPSAAFLWPLDLTTSYQGSFGYVMDLRPPQYAEVDDFMLNRTAFSSYRRAVDACMYIVQAFGILHDWGYAYQDLNSKNFFIDPSMGRVLICDNDNVVPSGVETDIIGTWGYMAPEVVRGGRPDALSDLHSLAVILFMLLLKTHPLEGKATSKTLMGVQDMVRIYGEKPLFVFDEQDGTNGLDETLQGETISQWHQLPSYLRELFLRVFSQEALGDPRQRPVENEWLRALARFRSEIQRCPCGRCEVVLEADSVAECELCGAHMRVPLTMVVGTTALPVAYDTRLFRCQTQLVGAEHALEPVAQVVRPRGNPDRLELLNRSGSTWEVRKGMGGCLKVDAQCGVAIDDGMRVTGERLSIAVRASRGECS